MSDLTRKEREEYVEKILIKFAVERAANKFIEDRILGLINSIEEKFNKKYSHFEDMINEQIKEINTKALENIRNLVFEHYEENLKPRLDKWDERQAENYRFQKKHNDTLEIFAKAIADKLTE